MKAIAAVALLLSTTACDSMATSSLTFTMPSSASCMTMPPSTSVTDPRNGDVYTFNARHSLLRSGAQTVFYGVDNDQPVVSWTNLIMTDRGPYVVGPGGWSYVSHVRDVWLSAGYAWDVLTPEELHPAGCPVVSIGGL